MTSLRGKVHRVYYRCEWKRHVSSFIKSHCTKDLLYNMDPECRTHSDFIGNRNVPMLDIVSKIVRKFYKKLRYLSFRILS